MDQKDFIRKTRKYLDMTQVEFTKKFGLTHSKLANYETGRSKASMSLCLDIITDLYAKGESDYINNIFEKEVKAMNESKLPDWYIGMCEGDCHGPRYMTLAIPGVFPKDGVYVCESCGYQHHPDYPPEKATVFQGFFDRD